MSLAPLAHFLRAGTVHPMVAHASSLPEINAEDSALLLAYFAADADFARLADSPAAVGRSLIDLYIWSTREHIAPWIAFHKAQLADAARRRALQVLDDLSANSPDPVERRRAVTTLLRALSPAAPRSPKPAAPDEPRIAARFSSPPDHIDETREAFFAPGEDCIQTAPPAATPHPDVRPVAVACGMIAAMQSSAEEPAHLITLFNHSGITDRSRDSFEAFCTRLRDTYPEAFAPGLCDLREHGQTSPDTYSCAFILQHDTEPRPLIHLNLFRPIEGPLAGCWLVDFFADSS